MRRRMLSIAAVLSLLVCVTMIVMWATGGNRLICLRDWGGGKGGRNPMLAAGVFLFFSDGQAGIGWTRSDVGVDNEIAGWTRSDLLFDADIAAPDWVIIAATLLPPLFYFWRMRRRHRGQRRPGRGKRVLRIAGSTALLLSALGVIVLMWPWWASVLTFLLALPVSAAIFREERRLTREACGLCVNCGYDLTGNASGICPECGTRITQPLPTPTDDVLPGAKD